MKNIMTYKGYSASMEFDPDDKIIVGRVLNIDDIISFHAESVDGFEQVFHQSIDDYLAACEQLEQVPEKPASGKLMLRISPKIHAAALKSAQQSGQSMNKWVESVLAKTIHS
ncbi:HicB [Thiomicrospira aerophila AL3]|uniref:HicB n=1 Tax=Thiomicrospira aerophila AL3 TaxID=717772 RepID=W0DSR4_9GAMM|nr:type II toxin-antitoxin system HicB family antitoxin [Thiomicrospira aerophila]AHF01487.1 HicB [Thiomicrospira aerophila AL3]